LAGVATNALQDFMEILDMGYANHALVHLLTEILLIRAKR
jgi:hypothetical protein